MGVTVAVTVPEESSYCGRQLWGRGGGGGGNDQRIFFVSCAILRPDILVLPY